MSNSIISKHPAVIYGYTKQPHRLDGPAVISSIYKNFSKQDAEWLGWYNEWYLQGKRHRLDGPAVEDQYTGLQEWWVNDIQVTESTHPEAVLLYKCKLVLES